LEACVGAKMGERGPGIWNDKIEQQLKEIAMEHKDGYVENPEQEAKENDHLKRVERELNEKCKELANAKVGTMSKDLTREQAIGVAARIWCDQDMETQIMDSELAEQIAGLLYDAFQGNPPIPEKGGADGSM